MNSLLLKSLQAEDVVGLKGFGSFLYVKQRVESQFGLKLGARGWVALVSKFKLLSLSVGENYEIINLLLAKESFVSAKLKVSKLLGFKLTVRNPSELESAVLNLLALSRLEEFDPHKRFEESKLKNFRNSSRLEGIIMPWSSEKKSLDSILAKHRRC